MIYEYTIRRIDRGIKYDERKDCEKVGENQIKGNNNLYVVMYFNIANRINHYLYNVIIR